MAPGTLPLPGSEYLCAGPCNHIDCAQIRKTAAADCSICKTPIGYGVAFYDDQKRGLCHAICLEVTLEGGSIAVCPQCRRPVPASDLANHQIRRHQELYARKRSHAATKASKRGKK